MAAERIGVFLSSHREAENLLACYDFDGNGTLDYKEFSAVVFGHKKAPSQGVKVASFAAPAQLDLEEYDLVFLICS